MTPEEKAKLEAADNALPYIVARLLREMDRVEVERNAAIRERDELVKRLNGAQRRIDELVGRSVYDNDNIEVTGLDEKKTPADRLAAVVEEFVASRAHPTDGLPGSRLRRMKDALDKYRSTRNGEGRTWSEAVGSPPDPVRLARLIVDSITGGALSSLICAVRDDLIPWFQGFQPSDAITIGGQRRNAILGNIKANLRALGEKIP